MILLGTVSQATLASSSQVNALGHKRKVRPYHIKLTSFTNDISNVKEFYPDVTIAGLTKKQAYWEADLLRSRLAEK